MTQNPSRNDGATRSRRGFALLITIVLLAFLVLLLVILSSMTRVETQVSSNQQQMVRARQNALLGLQIALGQLQKYAGPDQRVTATADLNSTSNTTVANPHYTGVWNVAAVNASAKINIPCSPDTHSDPADINHDNPVPFVYTPLPNPATPAVWLVSGNENPSAPTAVAYNTDTSGSAFVTLVGNATTTVNATTDTVRAEIVPITSANVPGVSGNTTIGKFAYWVGDEGVKAKFNVVDPYTPTPAFTPATTQTYDRQATAQRLGIEQMSIDGTSTTPGTTPIGPDYNPTAGTAASAQLLGNLGKVIAYPDTQLMSYPDPVTTFNPSTVFKNRYWDLTTSSYGLLTDTANGGLKYDLTWDFSQAAKTGLLTGPIVQAVTWKPSWPAPGSGQGWYPSYVSTANHLDPQWSVLRGFYQLTPALSPSQFDPSTGDVILSSAQGTPRTNENIMPVLTQVRLYWGVHADYNADGTVNGSPLAKQYVLFLVANPYDMPLSVPNGLNFHVITWGNNIDMDVTNGATTWTSFELFYDLPDSGWFSCPKALTFQPGEVKAFVLSADVPYSSTGLGPSQLESVTDTPDFNSQNPYAITIPLSSPTTLAASKAVAGWRITLSLSDEDTGYGALEMLSAVPNTSDTSATGTQALAWINTFSFALPATGSGTTGNSTTAGMGSYVSNNNVTSGTPTTTFNDPSGSTDFDIGGMVFSLKMPAETGYTSSAAIRFLADYNTRNETMGSYAGDALTLYYSYYQPDSDSFLQNIAPPTWGLSSSIQTGTDLTAILYHIPRPPAGAPAWEPVIMSIADLKDANVTTTAQEPTYAIGNSYASVFCQPQRSVSWPQANDVADNRSNPSWRYDMSYLCNEALWDTYYFSTVPQTSVSASATYNPHTDTLPDSRYVPAPGPLDFAVKDSGGKAVDAAGAIPQQRDFTASSVSAAALLRINGAFNVNSTSVEAWKAVFSSLRGLNYTAPDGTSTDTNLSGPFFRTLWQTHGKTDPPASLWANAQTGTDMNSWTGFRNLSSSEIDALATAMVAQVRLRGPFRSLGDFVNRRLPSSDTTPVSDPNGLSLRGTLQAAIDAAGINSQFNSNPNPSGTDQVGGNDVTAAYSNQTQTADLSWSFMTPANAVGNRATGAPGWLMQADVLQAIGACLADRSDTFVIRSYGEVVNPVTGATTGRAWCEAVVQRIPDYVDPTNAPTVAPAPAVTLTSNQLTTTVTSNSLTNSLTTLTTLNQTFGRRFKIVSFRWLGPGDI